jgi:PAS domain S-box-containing protein
MNKAAVHAVLESPFCGHSRMAQLMREFDWRTTPLGPVEKWPRSLKTAVGIVLGSRYPMFLWWGPDCINFYNDAYIPVLGQRHPWALGQPASRIWYEIWDMIGPQSELILRHGQASWHEQMMLIIERNGYPEETYFTFSHSPVPDDHGGIGGVFCACTEDTQRTLSQRRMRTLRALAAQAIPAQSAGQACQLAAEALAANPNDVPFAMLYLLDATGQWARLTASVGLNAGHPAAPAEIEMGSAAMPWPLDEVLASGSAVEVGALKARLGPMPGGVWPESPDRALVLPMDTRGSRIAGFVITGASPRLAFDDEYAGFMHLLAGHVTSAVVNARAHEAESRRASALAELDRVKTDFFSNISHEFRTPLTLMLGPLEELLDERGGVLLPQAQRRVWMIHRNARRLLKLVNALLDFSRAEVGRRTAAFRPADLAAQTRELASLFHSAVERAGLLFMVDCPPLSEAVYVDVEMWERIVLNLISNALKYTLSGEIQVRLRPAKEGACLTVCDTGIGIPEAELPHLFDRFYRVPDAAGRSHEGTGIGLALVRELVELHGGTVQVRSRLGRGSSFSVMIPFGRQHLPADQVHEAPAVVHGPHDVDDFVNEAREWLRDTVSAALDPPPEFGNEDEKQPALQDASARPKVLVVDDNADMRVYLRRLLQDQYTVFAASNGAEALLVVTARKPDLVLSDVVMPQLDGFGLLKALRADPMTVATPVILLSARAGEEARLESIEAGADDFVVKPFSARELLARVGAAVTLSRFRQDALRREEELRAEIISVLESMADAYVGLDARWQITSVNAAAERVGDMRRGKMLGRAYWDVFPDMLGTEVEREFRYAMAKRVTVQFETYYAPADCWFEVSAYPIPSGGLAVYARDINDRKRAEAQLMRSEQRFRVLAEASPALIWLIDPQGEVVYLNPRFRDLVGQESEQMLGHRWQQVLHPDDASSYLDAISRAQAKRIRLRQRTRVRSASGEWRWLDSHALPWFWPQDVYAGHVGISVDITETVRAEEALKDADRRKDEFLATLAHELRNPLAPIRSTLQLLRRSGPAVDAKPLHEMMERQVNHMARLVDDLLEVARITEGKIELRKVDIDLAQLISTAIETSRPVIDAAEHRLVVQLPDEPLTVHADEVRMAQVFSNLLNNAAKYTERGGTITVAVGREGGEVVASVADTGVGIPPDMLPRVFDLFTQVNDAGGRAKGGLGIGLTLVRNLVEKHGGRVEAFSAGAGRGSRFIVRLPISHPAHPGDVVAKVEPVHTEGEDVFANRRILLVDDNADAAEAIGALLKFLGARVETALGGKAALAAMPRFQPEVVLLDLGMPDMDGFEVARCIRAQPQFGDVMLVAVTGWGQSSDMQRTHDGGFDHHLIKPVDIDALGAIVKRVADRAANQAGASPALASAGQATREKA